MQGWQLADYLRCVDLYRAAGVDLAVQPLTGLGSVCRRQSTGQIAVIVTAPAAAGLRLHGFGIKTSGLYLYGHLLVSADSMAWSYAARRSPGTAHDRFAVGAATLSMLAAYAEQGPAVVAADDAQWPDWSSAQALLFAFRRLVADPIAVFIACREGEPSLFDGAGLPTAPIGGLTSGEAAMLVPGLAPEVARRPHQAAAGNPLALLELASGADELVLAPSGAPVLVSASISRAFLQRACLLDQTTRQALVLSAASDTGDLPTLERAAARLGIDLSVFAAAEGAGLVRFNAGVVEFRHPLARSAIYADAPASQRREAHRALAAALPDRDIDRRAAAWIDDRNGPRQSGPRIPRTPSGRLDYKLHRLHFHLEQSWPYHPSIRQTYRASQPYFEGNSSHQS